MSQNKLINLGVPLITLRKVNILFFVLLIIVFIVLLILHEIYPQDCLASYLYSCILSCSCNNVCIEWIKL